MECINRLLGITSSPNPIIGSLARENGMKVNPEPGKYRVDENGKIWLKDTDDDETKIKMKGGKDGR